MADRFEINHEGKIVTAESALCANLDNMLAQLFSQYGWQSKQIDKAGACRTLELTDPNGKERVLHVYTATIRNELRSPYEKKIQLGTVTDPKEKNRKNTIILGIYVFQENDTAKDAIFVGFPVDNSIRYDTNPSIRGVHVNKLLAEAKSKGFVYDSEHNNVGFRAEFIFYYLDNFEKLHYGSAESTEPSSEDEQEEPVLDCGKNIILYGVPGCGKSHEIKTKYCKDPAFMERVVFHPDYTYSDFVGQILPKTDGEKISYPFTAGPFTTILKKAIHDPDHMYYLVLEEINRGNAPAIFGEVFQLLDRENGESEYGITNFDIAKCIYGPEGAEEEIKIPKNLTILATMNTADQNVFTLDTAFKRRWTMRSIENNISACSHAPDPICDTAVTWGTFAEKINEIIIDIGEGNLSSEDNRLGAYFVKAEDLQDAQIFAEKVLMYLWNDAFKYDRDKVFKTEYRTLEELLTGFYKHKFGVFVPQLGFDDVTTQADVASTLAGSLSEDEHLKNKNPELVELYGTIREMVSQRVPNLHTYTPNSKAYIGLGSENSKRKSFAEFVIKRGYLSLEIEKPTNADLQDLGEEIEYNGSHDHYFKIVVTKESDLDTVVAAIIDSYEQLKKGN